VLSFQKEGCPLTTLKEKLHNKINSGRILLDDKGENNADGHYDGSYSCVSCLYFYSGIRQQARKQRKIRDIKKDLG
jgi:hypothetical protein